MKHDPEDPFGWPPSEAAGAAHSVPDERPGSAAEPDPPPPTEPAGALVPPPKVPGTALSAPAVPPPPPHRPQSGRVRSWEEHRVVIGGSFDLLATINRVLDTLDVVGDTIAHAAGVRPRDG